MHYSYFNVTFESFIGTAMLISLMLYYMHYQLSIISIPATLPAPTPPPVSNHFFPPRSVYVWRQFRSFCFCFVGADDKNDEKNNNKKTKQKQKCLTNDSIRLLHVAKANESKQLMRTHYTILFLFTPFFSKNVFLYVRARSQLNYTHTNTCPYTLSIPLLSLLSVQIVNWTKCGSSGVYVRVFVCSSVCVCVQCVGVLDGSYNFCTISYFFRRSTLSFFGSYFFLAANFARSSAAVIFKFSPSLAPFVAAIYKSVISKYVVDTHTHTKIMHK